jgi:hypothetical protein
LHPAKQIVSGHKAPFQSSGLPEVPYQGFKGTTEKTEKNGKTEKKEACWSRFQHAFL